MSNFHNNDSPFSANGRFGRLSYLGWNMLLGLSVLPIAIIAAFLTPMLTDNTSNIMLYIVAVIGLFFYIGLIYLTFIFTIRRLHDKNQSGWLSLIALVPLINIFFMLYLIFAPGTQGANNYGQPRDTKTWEKVLAWMYILIFPLGILAAIAIPAYQDYTNRAQQQQYQQQINQSE